VKNPALLVMSDSHGNLASLRAVLSWGKKHQIDAAVFLGDGAYEVSQVAHETAFTGTLSMVRGNGDALYHIPLTNTVEFAGYTFLITHGHQSRVSEGLDGLVAAAHSLGADAALYGHTHVPFWEEIDGLLVLNPGSVGSPRSNKGASFAVIECPPDEWFKIQYWGIKDGVMGKVIEKLAL
jgi:putative phosphoesterase